ncbi:hypothetical protein ACSMFR_04600 [Listeria aquatica]|uniref:Uncharacterized protein n=1 Tax=Listeria aquatica TaxID=1494960 RepID=A0A841ZMW9_9LIST|nr:hypothetical protein [Listeria aquatica]MBC1522019.1 hypothetical protein [Listeria aquatica]
MSNLDIRYYVIPMIVIFILGIAGTGGIAFPLLNFLMITLVACVSGGLIGALHQLFGFVMHFNTEYKKKRTPKKDLKTQYHEI